MPTFDTCVALSKAFGLSAEEILRMAGLLPKPPGYNRRTSEMIGIFAELSDDDQDEILQMMQLKRQREQKKHMKSKG